jgi:hypothetical protein
MSEPQHYSIVVLDVESSGTLSDPEKKVISDDLYALVREALAKSGIPSGAVREEDRGDGIFLLIGADVRKRLLFEPFLGLVDGALATRSIGEPPLRLRLVIHHGEVIVGDRSASGRAVDTAFVLLDSPQLRDALRESRRGRLALAVPDELYQSLVCGYDEPDPNAFRRRFLETKYGTSPVWVTVTGVGEQPGSGRRPLADPPEPTAGPRMDVRLGDENHVEANNGVVGGHHSGTINFGRPPSDPRGN